MATAKPVNIDELLECPVCCEIYTDPRLLDCGHQFCLKCLEQIVLKKPPQQDKITCPTCTQITLIKPGKQVKDLTRPRLMNEVQNLLKNLVMPSKRNIKKCCDFCEAQDTIATAYCYQCHQNMCDSCLSKHRAAETFEAHKIVAINDYLFCPVHYNIVTRHCNNCEDGICSKCIVTEHSKHITEDIHAMAKQSRDKVQDLTSQLPTANVGQAEVQAKVKELKQAQNNMVGQIDGMIETLNKLKSELERTRDKMFAETSADIKTLKMYEADLVDWNTSKASLVDYGKYLMDRANDPELVSKVSEFTAASNFKEMGQPPSVNMPTTDKLDKLETELAKLMKISIQSLNSLLPRPIEKLQLKKEIEADNYFHSVAINHKLSTMAVRNGDSTAPIIIFDMNGVLLYGIGKGIKGLTEERGLSIDPQRDLFLAPCYNHLTTIDRQGQVHDVIQVKDSELRGVAYSDSTDQYVVTDIKRHMVIIVDAKTRKVVSSFGSEGSGDDQFKRPIHLCVGDIQGRATIVVSDCWNHAVKLFDLTGHHIKTFGSEGSGEGQLVHPRGVAVDPVGRVLVCDWMNRRVVSFWSDTLGDYWQCLLSGLGTGYVPEPIAIDIDPVNKLLALCLNGDNLHLYTFE